MPNRTSKQAQARLYQNDIVQKLGSRNESAYAVVLRCWHDPEDIPPQASAVDPLLRPLKKGEVGISYISHRAQNEICSESQLRLIDRCMQPGDYCKRSIDDMRSGVILGMHVRGRLAHVISGEPVEGWKTLDDLQEKRRAEIGDYITYDDWVGQIIEVFDDSVVEMASGKLVRFPELGCRLAVGDVGSDILPPAPMSMQNGAKDTVIESKHTVYAIAWLALNQMLDTADAEKKTRPDRFWTVPDFHKLTLIRGKSDVEMRVGDRVALKDPMGQPVTAHGSEDDEVGIVHLQTYEVIETVTMLDVLWQDGVRETVRSTELIPYVSPDEYDCQAIMCFGKMKMEHGATADERVSVLELDHSGTSEPGQDPNTAFDGFGVRRGDFVFIHKEGTTNGCVKPRVPRIGELESWVRDIPFDDGHYSGWRKEMNEIGNRIAADERAGAVPPYVSKPEPGDTSLHWIGEVTELRLDGTIEVTHPDWTVKVYPVERLTRLYDGMEQLDDDMFDDGGSEGYEDVYDETWAMDDDGHWQLASEDGGEWEDVYDDLAEPVDDGDVSMEDVWEVEGTHPEEGQPEPDGDAPVSLPDSDHWKRFEILSSAPADHAFYSSVPTRPSKQFIARLQKEYRILSTSLPESIIVRAYEDRADLLRSLIIGPENTPYQDAPFVIDWMLDSNFPNSPPIAHFLSWTNGNGRVNPNLYEEGKVCLSILGTWVGDQTESWSAARSSLLQAFVSIQGLVLVKEPWFCEPAFDKLRGTEEGTINSRLYNEKAYVLSRGFIRRALEFPPGGLESELQWLYYANGVLRKVLDNSRRLVDVSRKHPEVSTEDSDLAVPRLTEGGILTLERTLTKLQHLLDSREG
ncbi:hypothetical protein NMY22_g567 [Coprinellus aureogranulatus]|nr:hypothetical protein NMY22_g567 [Coprinellus aureogranulatus]